MSLDNETRKDLQQAQATLEQYLEDTKQKLRCIEDVLNLINRMLNRHSTSNHKDLNNQRQTQETPTEPKWAIRRPRTFWQELVKEVNHKMESITAPMKYSKKRRAAITIVAMQHNVKEDTLYHWCWRLKK